MVSHCVPSAIGSMDRTRAWQFLKLFSQSHRVHLACLLDGPVNLAQWRTVNGQSQQFVIDTARLPRVSTRWWNKLLGRRNPELGIARKVWTQLIENGGPTQKFDAILCTHPTLLSNVRSIDAPVRICDLNYNMCSATPDTELVRSIHESQEMPKVDLLVLSQSTDGRTLEAQKNETIVMPLQIDPDFFYPRRKQTADAPSPTRPPNVVVHCQWEQNSAARATSWFANRIWPSIAQVVPNARLVTTRPGAHDPYNTLNGASIIVCPDPNPHRPQLHVLQAMAMRKPVIASDSAGDQLKLTSGPDKPMLLGHREPDWIGTCVSLLRSTKMRIALSSGADQWINQYPTIEQSGRELIKVLAGTSVKRKPISLAA